MTTIAFIGDVMLGRGVNEELRHHKPEQFWGTALPILRGTDAVIANLECAITTHRTPWSVVEKVFYFRADPPAVEVLRSANVRAVSLANNHVLDFEEQGLVDTLDHLDRASIAHAGAGKNLACAKSPAIVRLPELTVGVVGLTDNEPSFAARGGSSGTNYVDIERGPAPGIGLASLADACRDRGADLAILSIHWGPNMVTEPPQSFRAFAHAAIEAGFDVIHGHSAHVFQGVEVHLGRPIFYDTGDVLDDYAIDPELRNDWSFVFLVDVRDKHVERVRMVPLRLGFARVDLATGSEAAEICDMMKSRSKNLGTEMLARDGGLEVVCRKNLAAKKEPPVEARV